MGILIGITGLFIYLTNRYVPFMMDDLWYSTILSDESVPIASLRDILQSQIWHYQNWGGRSVTHSILQLTLLAGEQAADLLNVGVTFLLAWVICAVAENRSLPAFFSAAAMILGLNANWKMSMFWQSGAANYLYITVAILSYVFCYLREMPDYERREMEAGGIPACTDGAASSGRGLQETGNASVLSGRDSRESGKRPLPGVLFWILPLGIAAGWSNENMGPAVWLLSLAVTAMIAKEKRKVPLWMIFGNLACLAGSVILIAAPGNAVRSAQAADSGYGILWRTFLRGYAESRAVLEYLFPTLLVLLLVLLVGKCALGIAVGGKNLLLLICAALSWGVMALSPHYPDRAAFGTMALLICVIVSMAGKIVKEREDMFLPLWGVFILIWLRGMYFCGEFLAVCWGWIR